MTPIKWSVVGIGTAGRARARAIHEDPDSSLVCVWKGRHAGSLHVPLAESLSAAIDAADAVAICSPTPHHRAQVEAVLRAGRHAVVEFPMAQTPADARALFELARRMDRVLHVEHIELLDPANNALCGQVRPEIITEVSVQFQRPGPEDAGAPALAVSNVARLHRLCAVAGEVASVESVTESPGTLKATLRLVSGCTAQLLFQQAPYFKRQTTLEVHTPTDQWKQVDGAVTRNGKPVSLLGVRSLFGRDHAVAMNCIRNGADSYVTPERILHVLEVVERLSRQQLGPL